MGMLIVKVGHPIGLQIWNMKRKVSAAIFSEEFFKFYQQFGFWHFLFIFIPLTLIKFLWMMMTHEI